jgi:hypothetical protein
LALVIGCNSSGGGAKTRERVVSSMEKVYGDLGNASQQIQRTDALLEEFQQGADLKSTFKNYQLAVNDLEAASEQARERARAMRENREAYLAKWQSEAEHIQNPQVKEDAMQRRERVAANFQKLTGMADDVRAAYRPYISDVQEIEKALGQNLTPAQVNTMRPSIDRAMKNGDVLNQKLDALGKELNSLLGRLSPTGAK